MPYATERIDLQAIERFGDHREVFTPEFFVIHIFKILQLIFHRRAGRLI